MEELARRAGADVDAFCAARRAGVRIEETTLMFFDPHTRELLRTLPSPLTWDQACTIRGASPAGLPARPSAAPVTVQRRASHTGVIMAAGQKAALGRIHAGQAVTVHVAEHTLTIDPGGDDTRTIRRTTTQAVRSIKAHRPRKARTTHVSQGTCQACAGTDSSSIRWDSTSPSARQA